MMRIANRSETLLALVGCMLFGLATASAQQRSRGASYEDIKLQTKDGVRLAITYYPSDMGKEAVPVVMLHDYKESRNVYQNLAEMLQQGDDSGNGGHAVITVDLRGHGESTVQVGPNGRTRDLEASRLRPADYQDMVGQDMEAVRRFLVKKNDSGELNLNALCLVGAGMGANVATYWSAADWAAPKLATLKQGQDVKALVLASPEWGFRGLPLLQPLRQPGLRSEVSFLIIFGDQKSKAKKDANNVFKNLERYHPEPPPEKVQELKDLFLIGLPTKLQGTKLLTSREFGMGRNIQAFIEARITERHFPWVSRKK